MVTVIKLLKESTHDTVFTVSSTDSVLQALQVMSKENIGAVLVTEGEKIVGIFTERDYARHGEVEGRAAKDTHVAEMMTHEMVLIKPETTVRQCAELMGKYHVRHLPVLDGERVIGLVSLRRMAEALLEEHRETIIELENYIMGTGYGR